MATRKTTSARPKRKPLERNGRLAADDWINLAIQVMNQYGVHEVRVERLAKLLKVTKGSFYWHFEDRAALLNAVLEKWRRKTTDEIQRSMDATVEDPRERLVQLTRIAITPRSDVPGGPFELTLREWARRDKQVAAILRQVDSQRCAWVQQLYEQAGFSKRRAADHAFAYMAFVNGGRQMLFDGTPEDLERRRRVAQLILMPKRER